MFMAEGMDTGDILLKASIPVGPEETTGELFDRLKDTGAQLLIETLKRLGQGNLERIPQNDAQATLAPMLKKEMARIDWTQPAKRIHDLIRGLNPWPCAAAELEGRRIKLLSSRVIEHCGEPGRVFQVDGQMVAACGQGALRIVELQTDKGKRMSGKDYLLGHPLGEDARFL